MCDTCYCNYYYYYYYSHSFRFFSIFFRLQEALDFLASRFSSSGLVGRYFERDSIKLHITVMNKLFRKPGKLSQDARQNTDQEWKKQREVFNATQIIKVLLVALYNRKLLLIWSRVISFFGYQCFLCCCRLNLSQV